MKIYGRILVPLDGTSIDEPLLEHVQRLAAACEATVVLLRVAHFHTRDSRTHELDDCRDYAERAKARLDGHGFAVETVVAGGEPAETIIAQAHEQRADLIAMATHGHGAVSRLVLGSVADHVRHNASVPLLFVKGGSASPES
jgi:nucleotide-binding universal stress UspA family protein